MASCVAVAFALISLQPPRYGAEARLLTSSSTPPALETGDTARKVMAELRIAGQPGFELIPPAPWWKNYWVETADVWIAEHTGLSPLSWLPPPDPAIEARFWSHVTLRQHGKVLIIRVTTGDPVQAADIANALSRRSPPGASLLSPAAAPASPDLPLPPDLLVWVAAAGILAGAIAAWSIGNGQRGFDRAAELEAAAGIPVTARIPKLEDGRAAIVHVLREPASDYTEALRRLPAALQPEGRPAPHAIGIASALPGEGRSTLAASLGRLLAGEGRRVLLIDCDWRHPDLHNLFRLNNDTGLTALLVDKRVAFDDIIQTDALSGLDIITAGRRNKKAFRVLLSERMRGLLAELADSYDLILLDMPPVLAADEVLLLSRLVDRVLFLVRWSHTRRQQALAAIERILGTEGEIGGIALTRIDPAKS